MEAAVPRLRVRTLTGVARWRPRPGLMAEVRLRLRLLRAAASSPARREVMVVARPQAPQGDMAVAARRREGASRRGHTRGRWPGVVRRLPVDMVGVQPSAVRLHRGAMAEPPSPRVDPPADMAAALRLAGVDHRVDTVAALRVELRAVRAPREGMAAAVSRRRILRRCSPAQPAGLTAAVGRRRRMPRCSCREPLARRGDTAVAARRRRRIPPAPCPGLRADTVARPDDRAALPAMPAGDRPPKRGRANTRSSCFSA